LSKRLEANVDGRLLGVALRHSRAILPLSPDIPASVTALVGPTAALAPAQLPLLDLVPLDEAGTNTTALRERLRIPAGARIIGGFADCWAAGGADLFIQVAAHIRRTSGNDIHFLWSGPSGDEAGRRLLRGDLQRL